MFLASALKRGIRLLEILNFNMFSGDDAMTASLRALAKNIAD
jgi:hypothetical protein